MTTGEVSSETNADNNDAAAGDRATEANVRREEELEEGRLGGSCGGQRPIDHIVINACAMRVLDLTALASLADVVEEAAEGAVYVCMPNLSHTARGLLEGCGLLEQFGGDLVTMTPEEVYACILALRAASEKAEALDTAGEGGGEEETEEFKEKTAGEADDDDMPTSIWTTRRPRRGTRSDAG